MVIYDAQIWLYNNPHMKRSRLTPLWIAIIIAFTIGIGELTIRMLTSPEGFLFLSDIVLLLWGFLMFSGGLFSLISYFLETKWKGFQCLIWVYKNIMPVGGKVNAIIFGVIGILLGLVSIVKVCSSHSLLMPFFFSSINFDSLFISSGFVLYRISTKNVAAELADISKIPCSTSCDTCFTKSSLDIDAL